MDKLRLHRFLAENPDVRESIEADATGVPWKPKDEALRLAFEAGQREYAARLMSIYREVEADIREHRT